MTKVHILASRANRQGGADVYASELAKRLPDLGFDVTVVCHVADPDVRQACQVITVDRGQSTDLPIIWRVAPILQFASVERSLRRAAVAPPAVVLGMAHQVIWAHRRVFGARPLVYLPHGVTATTEVASYAWRSPIMRRLAVRAWGAVERDCLNRAFRTIRFTRGGCDVMEAHYGASARPRFAIVPPAVDIPEWVPDRPIGGPIRLLSVARLVPTKNIDLLVRVLGRINRGDWRLDILGEGPERLRLETMMRAAGLAERVSFHGHVDPAPFYAAAHILLLPSRLESAGLVIVEAMAYGVPTLAIRTDGAMFVNFFHDLIEDGENGFLARGEVDFARALESFIIDPHRLHAPSASARATAVARHGWQAHVRACAEILHAAASGQT